MLRVALALTICLALPASAAAVPLGELPFRAAQGSVDCLDATGVPGELTRETSRGVQFLRATESGLQVAGEAATTDSQFLCPRVAVAAAGAAVIAQRTIDDEADPFALLASARDPGGTWSAPKVLARGGDTQATVVAAASEHGDTAVAWTQPDNAEGGGPGRALLATRPPGGAFGTPAVLLRTGAGQPLPAVRIGYAASGELVAMWTHRSGKTVLLDAAVAPPGAPLGAAQRIGETRAGAAPALAVAADGSALIAFSTSTDLRVAERPPGGAFAAPVKVAGATDPFSLQVAAALAPGGAAAVGWRGLVGGAVGIVTRAQAGAFSAPVTLERGEEIPGGSSIFGQGEGLPLDLGDTGAFIFGADLRVALAGDRALITGAQGRTRDGVRWLAVRAATVPLGGSAAEAQVLGSPLRDVGPLTPMLTAAGTPAVAWADNRGGIEGLGRLHLAVAGSPVAAQPRAVKLTIGKPVRRRLRSSDPLRLPVRCSAACDIRVQEVGGSAEVQQSLARGRSTVLRVASLTAAIAPKRSGTVRFRVAWGAPGTAQPAVKVVGFRLVRRATPAPPKVVGLSAVRSGDRVLVSWRTTRTAHAGAFLVAGSRTRSSSAEPLAVSTAHGSGKRFTATLEPAEDIAFVSVEYFAAGGGRRTVVRVR